LKSLEARIAQPDFWSNQEAAQSVLRDRKRSEDQIAADDKLTSLANDLETYIHLAQEETNAEQRNDLLKELDYTVCSIHSRFALGKTQQTERILRAMDNRYFTILGHATGRLLLKRPGYEIEIDRVVQHARENGCFFEINSSPDRLDLSAENDLRSVVWTVDDPKWMRRGARFGIHALITNNPAEMIPH